MKNKKKLTYITRDIERALGMDPSEEYRIISNKNTYSQSIQALFPTYVTLIDTQLQTPPTSLVRPIGTGDLITAHGEYIKNTDGWKVNTGTNTDTNLIVFKNSARVEEAATKNGWHIINPPTSLAELIENKITQVAWLGELATRYLPAHTITPCKNLVWDKVPFILQWAHGHTGGGTVLITTPQELTTIQTKFPERLTRRTSYISGPSFTLNVVVTPTKILLGNISYQITGTLPFTDNIFATVGNDWGLTHSLLNEDEIDYIHTMAQTIGAQMRTSGWCGLFGIDVIRDDERNVIYLIEINARQPASTTCESILQRENRKHGVTGITTFEAHLKALQGEDITEDIILINDGAQILQRITTQTSSIKPEIIEKLDSLGYTTISYDNKMPNEDLLRIQSMIGIMETHNRFNKRGKEMLEVLTKS
jgi:hypothetical protein